MGLFGFKSDPYKEEQRLMRQKHFDDRDLSMLDSASHPQTEMLQLDQEKDREDLVMWQQDLTHETELFIHDLRREFWDAKTESWRPMYEGGKRIPPLCNDECIMLILAAVRPYLSKNEMMSNYNEDQIYSKLRHTMADVVINTGMNLEKHGIDYHNLNVLWSTIQNFIMATPWRAYQQGERNYIKSSTRRVETITGSQPQEQKKGFFGLKY